MVNFNYSNLIRNMLLLMQQQYFAKIVRKSGIFFKLTIIPRKNSVLNRLLYKFNNIKD